MNDKVVNYPFSDAIGYIVNASALGSAAAILVGLVRERGERLEIYAAYGAVGGFVWGLTVVVLTHLFP